MKKKIVEQFQSFRLYSQRKFLECLQSVPAELSLATDDFQRNYLYLIQANACLKLGRNQKARELYFKIYRSCRLQMFKDDYFELGTKALMNAGLATKQLGEMETAVQFYRQVLEENFIDNSLNLCRIHSMLGNALILIDPEDAWNHLQKSLLISREQNLQTERFLTTLNIIDYHIRMEEFESAESLIVASLEEVDPEQYPVIYNRIIFNHGALCYIRHDFKKAQSLFRKAMSGDRQPDEQMRILAYLAICHKKLDDLPKAQKLIQEAMSIAGELEIDSSFVESAYQQIMSEAPQKSGAHISVARTLFRRHGMIGVSTGHHRLMNDIDSLGNANQPVLVTGETGTGKELVARALHSASEFRDRVFIPINCPAIPESLFESILFGHLRGSFTGATENRIGLIEAAGDGTIFLDEIGDLPLSIQPKLLRFLESGEFTVMGSQKFQNSGARIISATNRDLEELVGSGGFREDLLQRISVFKIQVAPIREHTEDIFFIATAYLDTLNEQHKTVKSLSEDSILFLEKYSFPGNVRELKNLVLRGYQSAPRIVEPHHMGIVTQTTTSPMVPIDDRIELDSLLEEYERQLIEQFLVKNKGNQKRSADDLGISLRSLKYKLQKLGIRSQNYRG